MSTRTALLLGATGLVGGHCLNLLLNDEAYDRVHVLGRRPLPREHASLEQHVVDFERLEEHAHLIQAQDVFCCLGTTIRQAGSREAFRRVDFHYPDQIARIAVRQGAERFLIVTALGAWAGSPIFYNQVKGEIEEAIRTLSFSTLVIVRPSLLLGERAEQRRGERLGEVALRVLTPLLRGPLRKYRPIEARAVAAAMVRLAKEGRPGVRVVESDEIARIAGERG